VYRNRLYQNSPNPFNPETEIRFELAAASEVSIRIFDASGQLVRVLESGRRSAGVHAVRWNGLRETGEPVSSGVYFYRMTSAGFDETRKMVLLK
jgi:flagellar hook assembly protein FlgD